ncbi:MAG: TIGR02611 family protein [Acidimicrobiia bacterium]
MVGLTVVLAGIAMLVLPGPGWLTIIAGLGLLATEYLWARRLLKAKEQASKRAKAVGSGIRGTLRRKATLVEQTSDSASPAAE